MDLVFALEEIGTGTGTGTGTGGLGLGLGDFVYSGPCHYL